MARTPVQRRFTENIDQHVKLIAEQVKKSLRDPETRQLAVKIVSNRVDWRPARPGGVKVPMVEAWGQWFKIPEESLEKACPPREDLCEIELIWNFVVTNCRYVFDIADVDVFVTTQHTLSAGGGDCFPVGTLVLRDDGQMVPVETVQPGDVIHDGASFVMVLRTWDRGQKPIVALTLNNGSVLTLSDTHKVLRVPTGGVYGDAEEVRVHDLRLGDNLLQPREFGPWAKITGMQQLEEQPCVDIETASGRVYLPETDTIVRQCDDSAITFASLLKAIGFYVRARVISTHDNPNEWVHVYPLVGVPKANPTRWIPLDCTVTDAIPGWEYDSIAKARDYDL